MVVDVDVFLWKCSKHKRVKVGALYNRATFVFSVLTKIFALHSFLPIIIKGLGFDSRLSANLMSGKVILYVLNSSMGYIR
jgi:hypothetical protein